MNQAVREKEVLLVHYIGPTNFGFASGEGIRDIPSIFRRFGITLSYLISNAFLWRH
jgi:hypothetical protein